MAIFLITAAAFGLFVGLMAVGVIFGNREIKGSCGGLNNLQDEDGKGYCEVCGLPSGETCNEADAPPAG